MRKLDSKAKEYAYFCYRLVSPFFNPIELASAFPRCAGFFLDMLRYARSSGAEKMALLNLYPRLHEKTAKSPFDSMYFYQDIWAFKKIVRSKAPAHTDVGSRVDFVGHLSAVTAVTFVDIRPLAATVDNFTSVEGSILAMPHEEGSLASLSCLNVAEHIGLGRYGDPIDPYGTKKACKELSRILAKGGNLYFSGPIGKPRLCFNAHRIHSPKQILEYFAGLELVDFSAIDDKGNYREKAQPEDFENADFSCGLFHFTKK